MIAQLKTDAANISERMVLDFNDNFSYCPVSDSNTDKILQYKLESNVLDTVLASATLPASKNYLILVLSKPYFSSPSEEEGAYNYNSNKQQLVAYPKDFKMVDISYLDDRSLYIPPYKNRQKREDWEYA